MRLITLMCLSTLICVHCLGQKAATTTKADIYPQPVEFKTWQEDHDHLKQLLGIKTLRPGPSGNESAPNHANYDESLANPCPELPNLLLTKDGTKVTTPSIWWNKKRPEVLELLEREVYGRLPENIPNVRWELVAEDREWVGRVPVVAKQLIGHVDNSGYPLIDVQIKMMLVVPTNVKGPVPVLMMFGRPSFPSPAQPSAEEMEVLNKSYKKMMLESDPSLKEIFDKYPAYQPVTRLPQVNRFAPRVGDPSRTEELLEAGWAYCTIDPGSVQADDGSGLTKGIIGLVNQGQTRKPDQWGALRAWAWGAARGLDYLETDAMVDAKKVGIEGVSRYGKATLVTLAFEPRFAVGLIGSSGKGGTTLHRRVFGEAVESLTGGEYHWMAGNFIKYGASDATFGSKTGCDIPVDAHEMLALCAPRLTFVSYGIPEQGDAKWLDQKGSYMATIAAGSIFKLLGAKDLGRTNDYMKEEMPPVLEGLLGGELAWRQHDGGHTDAPNFKIFIPWASEKLGYTKIAP